MDWMEALSAGVSGDDDDECVVVMMMFAAAVTTLSLSAGNVLQVQSIQFYGGAAKGDDVAIVSGLLPPRCRDDDDEDVEMMMCRSPGVMMSQACGPCWTRSSQLWTCCEKVRLLLCSYDCDCDITSNHTDM
jgi:hypothetical protein